MRLYHFLEAHWALDDIKRRRLRISLLDSLNDPFEFLAVDLSNKEFRNAMMRTRKKMADWQGVICFCDNWRNPLMWAHYGDRYRGICLGFDVHAPDGSLVPMNYVSERIEPPSSYRGRNDSEWMKFFERLTAIKFEDWRYEGEHRLHIRLDESDAETENYFFDFGETLILREVIAGARCEIKRDEVKNALGALAPKVTAFKSRAGFERFEIVRNLDESMWS